MLLLEKGLQTLDAQGDPEIEVLTSLKRAKDASKRLPKAVKCNPNIHFTLSVS